jgi:hypothetical protein
MTRRRRTQERRRELNIRELSEMLGFTDPKVFPKILVDFWSPKFPHGQLADASDEQITQVADDFLEQYGSELWSIRGRGPLYPDDADEDIKPKIFEILRRQRRNQLDTRMRRDRQQLFFSEKPFWEKDINDELMNDRSDTSSEIIVDNPKNHGASGVDLMDTVRERRQDVDENDANATTPGPAASLAQSASIFHPFHQSGLSIVCPAERTHIPSTIQNPSLQALSPLAVSPQKRGFEEMSADVSPTAPTVTTQHATSRKILVLKNSFLALPAENEARSTYKRPSVEHEPPGPKLVQSRSTRLRTTKANELRPVAQENAALEETIRTTEGVHGPICDNGVAQSYRWQRPDNDADHPAGIDAHQDAFALRTCPEQIGRPDRELLAGKQGESVSYDIFQNNYSVELNKAPGLLRFLLRYCEDGMIKNRQNIRDGLTAEDRSSARIGFFAMREILNAFQEEGLRVGAHLNY